MDRRRFLELGGAACFAFGFQKTSAFARDEPAGPLVLEASTVSYESVTALLERMGGLRGLVPVEPSRATIVLKPNICLPDPPGKATTTSPELIDLICRRLIADGAKRIVIADHTLQKSADFERTPWVDFPKKYPEVRLLLAHEERLYEPMTIAGKVLTKIDVLRLLQKADLFINIPTAKHHSATHVSLGLKNLMGVVWNRSDFHTAMDLHRGVADLATAIKPSFTIIDASRVLLTGGPTGPGKIIPENRLFAGRDILALDALVSSRYSFGGKSLPPSRIEHLQAASEAGVGEIDLAKIRVEKV